MIVKTKGVTELFKEVIDKGLCAVCGACIGFCPYQVFCKGKVRRLDQCSRSEGHCYEYCPRTFTDMEAVSNRVVGKPYDGSAIGAAQSIFIARAKRAPVRLRAQYGGTVTAILMHAMDMGIIDQAILAKTDKAKLPSGCIARTGKEILEAAGSNYVAYPALESLNMIERESTDKAGIVVTPCQALALAKMRTYPSEKMDRTRNIKLVVGLFCTWALSYEGFYDFLKEKIDVTRIKKFDIPPPPANTFDVYLGEDVRSFSLDEIRKFRMTACLYCLDMTAELTDIAVGSAEGIPGWNTVIVRTAAGSRVIESARSAGIIEVDDLPAGNLAHLKTAAMMKKKRAIKEIMKMTGGNDGLLYLGLPEKVKEKLLSQAGDQGESGYANH